MLGDDKIKPNINSNLLPTCELGGSMNALEIDEKEQKEILDLEKLEISMKDLLGMLLEIEQVKLNH